jgi:hypothetical protein
MHLEKYQYRTDKKCLNYEFYSYGPKGCIKKGVHFQPDILNGIPYYNLVFGDIIIDDETVNDQIRSNNADAEKVLATVAVIVIDFINCFPYALVYAQGSTASRTRKYQMGITRLWDEIEPVFEVYGVKTDQTLEKYQKNVNYEAFWLKRRQMHYFL